MGGSLVRAEWSCGKWTDIDLDRFGSPLRISAGPNPFEFATALTFELPGPAHADLSLFDMSGRLIVRLIDEERAGGIHSVVWNGRDQLGRVSPAGRYCARLAAGSRTAICTVARLR